MWDRHPGTVNAAWSAAVCVTARAYKLSEQVLGSTAPGGRSKRTPPAYWLPRKVAIYVAVLACDCTYAALARSIGMHRDTVTSQVDEVRELVAEDRMLRQLVDTLERNARARLVGVIDIIVDGYQADRDHIQSLRRDRLPTRVAAIRQNRGGLKAVTEILSALPLAVLE